VSEWCALFLIGHEFPYAIQLSNARNSDQGMDHSHLQFVIRRRQRSMESSSAGMCVYSNLLF